MLVSIFLASDVFVYNKNPKTLNSPFIKHLAHLVHVIIQSLYCKSLTCLVHLIIQSLYCKHLVHLVHVIIQSLYYTHLARLVHVIIQSLYCKKLACRSRNHNGKNIRLQSPCMHEIGTNMGTNHRAKKDIMCTCIFVPAALLTTSLNFLSRWGLGMGLYVFSVISYF